MVALRVAAAFLVCLFGVGCADLQLLQLSADELEQSGVFTIKVELRIGAYGFAAMKTAAEHQSYLSTKKTDAENIVKAELPGMAVTSKVGQAPGGSGNVEAQLYIIVNGMTLSSFPSDKQTVIETNIGNLGTADSWNLGVLHFSYAPADQSAGLTSDQAAAPAPAAGGTGDPHLTNMHGQRFDLYQPGVHVLIQVPRRAKPEDTLLRVEADARRLGEACADLYFQVLNITGKWTPESGGLQFFANKEPDNSDWRTFGDVGLKVVRGHTGEGIEYLNVYVKHLNRVQFPVGGLLGEDDHAAAATPDRGCSEAVELHAKHRSFAMIEG